MEVVSQKANATKFYFIAKSHPGKRIRVSLLAFDNKKVFVTKYPILEATRLTLWTLSISTSP